MRELAAAPAVGVDEYERVVCNILCTAEICTARKLGCYRRIELSQTAPERRWHTVLAHRSRNQMDCVVA